MMKEQKNHEYIDDNERIALIKDETHPLYVVKDEKNILIDTGISAKAKKYHEAIDEVLQGKKIDTLLLTHSHFDHLGTCSYFQDIYDFDIACSYEAVELLKNPELIEMINYQNQELKEYFAANSDVNVNCEVPKNLGGLKAGDKIEISPESYFEVISTPGHSHCSLSYLLHPGKILFPGDSAGMMEKSGRKRPVFFTGFKDYENTLLKLTELKPQVLAFSHALYIKGEKEAGKYFSESLNEARVLKDKMLYGLMRGQDKMEIAERLAEQEYTPDSVMGRRETFMMHLMTLVTTISREFITTSYR